MLFWALFENSLGKWWGIEGLRKVVGEELSLVLTTPLYKTTHSPIKLLSYIVDKNILLVLFGNVVFFTYLCNMIDKDFLIKEGWVERSSSYNIIDKVGYYEKDNYLLIADFREEVPLFTFTFRDTVKEYTVRRFGVFFRPESYKATLLCRNEKDYYTIIELLNIR